jgi:hypothetical protein
MISVIIVIIEKDEDIITISVNIRLSFVYENRIYPIAENRTFSKNSKNKYLQSGFNGADHLIKSFTAK